MSEAKTAKVGDQIPEATVFLFNKGPKATDAAELFANGKSILISVPGPFTPTCHNFHLTGFQQGLKYFKEANYKLYCTAVNDAFVLDAWAKATNEKGYITMVSDGNASLAKALGLTLDTTGAGLGLRGLRYAMVINDGKIEYLGVDQKELKNSSAEAVLNHLGIKFDGELSVSRDTCSL